MQQDNKTINIDKLALEEIASDDAEKRKLLETYRLNISDIEKQLRESADNSVDIGELEEIRKQLKGLDGRKTEVNGLVRQGGRNAQVLYRTGAQAGLRQTAGGV